MSCLERKAFVALLLVLLAWGSACSYEVSPDERDLVRKMISEDPLLDDQEELLERLKEVISYPELRSFTREVKGKAARRRAIFERCMEPGILQGDWSAQVRGSTHWHFLAFHLSSDGIVVSDEGRVAPSMDDPPSGKQSFLVNLAGKEHRWESNFHSVWSHPTMNTAQLVAVNSCAVKFTAKIDHRAFPAEVRRTWTGVELIVDGVVLERGEGGQD